MKRDYLIKKREELKISQRQLAQRLQIAEITVRSIENGNRTPSLNLAAKYATFFDSSVESLFPDIFLRNVTMHNRSISNYVM